MFYFKFISLYALMVIYTDTDFNQQFMYHQF